MLTRRTFVASAAALAALPAVAAAQSETRYPAAAVRDDLDAIWSALIDVGVDPFQTADRAVVERLYQESRKRMIADLTLREAWLAIAPVLGALNDGHVGLGYPDPLNAAARRFPLRFALSDTDAVVVRSDRTQTIPIGSTLVSVDGIPAEIFRATALASLGGQTRALRRSRVTGSGPLASVALFGDKPSYAVAWIASDGATHTAPIAARAATPGSADPVVAPYAYRTLENGSVGLIDYRSCEDQQKFITFLTTTLDAINAAPIRALIVDIRQNGGGDSSLNDLLWENFSTKAFKQFGGVAVKSCARLKREYGREKYVRYYGQRAWDAADGTIFHDGGDPHADLIVHPADNDPQWYKGKIYLLIGPATFSSAMSCALAAKDYGLATIVGEETGEPVESTGEVYTFTSPQLGLRAYLTTKVFLPPKPHPPGQGVVPNVIVPTTLADRAAGRDPVLERTLALIAASS
jgi:hypothetical protein